MKITRDNYEEFFILYMDNELDDADRRMVESFARLHPDLSEELDILLQYKLVPDPQIVFEGKEELMKPALNMQQAELEEALLFYVDDELIQEEKIKLEKILETDNRLKAELLLLQKTRLQPEQIIFPAKASLYKHEPSYRIGVRWWRIAAAAILVIGLGLATFKLVNNNNKPAAGIVKTEPGKKETSPASNTQLPETNGNEQVKDNPAPETTTRNLALNTTPVKNKPASTGDKKQPDAILPGTSHDDVIASNIKTNNLPDPSQNPNVNSNISRPENVTAKNVSAVNNESLTNPDVTTGSSQPYIVQASLTNNDVMEPESKKNKLRGFFRKVTRTFEKRTNIEATDNDNKLLVAGISINLK